MSGNGLFRQNVGKMGFPKFHFQCGPIIDFLTHSSHLKIEGSNATIDPNLRSSAGADSDTDTAAPGEVTDDIVTDRHKQPHRQTN